MNRVRSHPAWGLVRFVGSAALYVVGVFFEWVGTSSIPGFLGAGDDGVTSMTVVWWLLAMIGWASVFVRRRHPATALFFGSVFAAAGSGYLLLFIGLFHQMSRSSRRRQSHLLALAVVVAVLSFLRDALTPWGDEYARVMQAPADSFVPSLVYLLLVTSGMVFAAMRARNKRSEMVLRDQAVRAEDRATQLDEELARKSERERIAREMHDTLAHRLSVVALQGGELEIAVAQGDPEATRIATALRQEARRSLDDLRGLLGELRSEGAEAYDAPRHSMRSIGELVRSARAAGTSVDAVIMVDGVERAAAVLDHTVFRIVQESLTNAMKHAAHAPVSIAVEASPGSGVRVRVANRVRTASEESARGAGAGIIGMRERVDQLGGRCEIGVVGDEFVVDVALPWVEVEPA